MALDYIGSGQVRKPEFGDARWDVPQNVNWEVLGGMLASFNSKNRVITGFDYAEINGLDFVIQDGNVIFDDQVYFVNALNNGVVPDGTTSFVYIEDEGSSFAIKVGPTLDVPNIVPLWSLKAEGGIITITGDLRIMHTQTVVDSVIKNILSSDSITDVFIYDTANDSDGGAWTNGPLAQASSWYNEQLNTATRGATREFPKLALIVAEADRVTIFDAIDYNVPMWMVFESSFDGTANSKYLYAGGTTRVLTNVVCINGTMCVGSIGIDTNGLGFFVISFLKDNSTIHRTTTPFMHFHPVAGRNNSEDNEGYVVSTTLPSIVNDNVNDVAMTLLDGAPIDPDTGIAVPTIAVATDGGVSVIDGPAGVGTVVNNAATFVMASIDFGEDYRLMYIVGTGTGNSIRVAEDYSTDNFADIYYSNLTGTSNPNFLNNPRTNEGTKAVGGLDGLTLLKEDPITPSEGMVDYITSDYQSGWMQGDIKGAWLADTEEGDIGVDTTTEHVVNGDFVTDVSGWTGYQGVGVISWDAGKLLATDTGAATSISTVIGQVYTILFDYVRGTTSYISFRVGSAIGGSDNANVSVQADLETGFKVTFMATGTTTWLTFISFGYTGTFHVDNVSGKAIQNLIENGEFSSDRAWLYYNVTQDTADNEIELTATATSSSVAIQTIGAIVGKKYKLTCQAKALSSNTTTNAASVQINGTGDISAVSAEDVFQELVLNFTSLTDSIAVNIKVASGAWGGIGDTAIFKDIVVEPLDVADRSANDNPLQVVGELTRTPVASGAELVSYSGFSVDDYIAGENTDYDDTRYLYGWEFDGESWEFKHGIASTNPLEGVSIVGNVIKVEGVYPKALIRIGTEPSVEQIEYIYNTEKKLFEPDALCTLGGDSSNVVALSYDESINQLVIATDTHTSFMIDGVRKHDAVPARTEPMVAVDQTKNIGLMADSAGAVVYDRRILGGVLPSPSNKKWSIE